jgi:hypothetical protein
VYSRRQSKKLIQGIKEIYAALEAPQSSRTQWIFGLKSLRKPKFLVSNFSASAKFSVFPALAAASSVAFHELRAAENDVQVLRR